MSATGRGAERHKDDFYATPKWAAQAIVDRLRVPDCWWLDPAAGEGALLDVVAPKRFATYGIELDQTRYNVMRAKHFGAVGDALAYPSWRSLFGFEAGDFAIVANPPYSLAMQFVERAIAEKPRCAIFLLRLGWMASQGRAAFHRANKADVYVLPRRPSFFGGRTDAAEYAWFVWGQGGGRWEVLEVPNGAAR